jgi:hypothetical protein
MTMAATKGNARETDVKSKRRSTSRTDRFETKRRMTLEEFGRDKHEHSLSDKQCAVIAMCIMKEPKKFSFACLVCNQQVRINQEIDHSWSDPISQHTNSGKYMVTVARRHCSKFHPSTRLWNVVPESRYADDTSVLHLDYFCTKQ